jgi:hypothetical protein
MLGMLFFNWIPKFAVPGQELVAAAGSLDVIFHDAAQYPSLTKINDDVAAN